MNGGGGSCGSADMQAHRMKRLLILTCLALLTSCSTTSTTTVLRHDEDALKNLSAEGFNDQFRIVFIDSLRRVLEDDGLELSINADSAKWLSLSSFTHKSAAYRDGRSITFHSSEAGTGALVGMGVGAGIGLGFIAKFGNDLGVAPMLLGMIVFLAPGTLIGLLFNTVHTYILN